MPTPPSAGTLLARTRHRATQLARSRLHLHLYRAARPPTSLRSQGRTAPGANDKEGTRKRTRHNTRRLVTAARRGAEDRTIDIWMPKPKSEGQLSTRRDAEHCGTFSRGATPNRDSVHRRTSSTKNFSCDANRSGSKPGEYSWSLTISSVSPCTPTIMVDGTSAFSSNRPHCHIR